jgi:hypothetical protein
MAFGYSGLALGATTLVTVVSIWAISRQATRRRDALEAIA